MKRLGSALLVVGVVSLSSACSHSAGGETSAHTSGASGPQGVALKLGVIAEGSGVGAQLANVSAGAKAAAQAINAAGGIDGRPVEIDTCDTNNNPNDAAACARKMVSDGIVALVGSATQYGANVLPVLSRRVKQRQ